MNLGLTNCYLGNMNGGSNGSVQNLSFSSGAMSCKKPSFLGGAQPTQVFLKNLGKNGFLKFCFSQLSFNY